MSPPRMNNRDFITLRGFYTQRLDALRQEILMLNVEVRQGLRGTCQTIERMKEIDTEVKGIIDCGMVMSYLRHG